MRTALATAARLLAQLANDPRTVVLVLAAPVVVVFLLHAVIESGEARPRIAVVGDARFAADLAPRADAFPVPDAAAARADLSSGKVDASIEFGGPRPKVVVDAADPALSGAALHALQTGLAERAKRSLPPFAAPMLRSAQPEVAFMNGSESTTTFDYLAPVILGFIVFFLTFVISGIAFLRERSSGTLERVLAGPSRPIWIVAGYMLGFGVVAAVQTTIAQAVVAGIYAAPMAGGFLPVLAIDLSLAATALAMGLFLSAFANSEFQMLQFIPLVVVPQVLFSGILNLRSAPGWISAVSELFPLTYAGRALRDVMLRGRTLGEVGGDLAAVWLFAAAFFVLAGFGLRRYRGR